MQAYLARASPCSHQGGGRVSRRFDAVGIGQDVPWDTVTGKQNVVCTEMVLLMQGHGPMQLKDEVVL